EEQRRDQSPAPRPPADQPQRPWRTEGVPSSRGDGSPESGRSRWIRRAVVLIAVYLVVFGLLSYQDRLGGPPTVSYTEFTKQVEAGNVAEVFSRGDRIEGVLVEPAPRPTDERAGDEPG